MKLYSFAQNLFFCCWLCNHYSYDTVIDTDTNAEFQRVYLSNLSDEVDHETTQVITRPSLISLCLILILILFLCYPLLSSLSLLPSSRPASCFRR